MRKIIHVDMDMFYAAVEMRDNPALRGKPLVIGGRPGTRSVVCTANYAARKYGIRSAMSCAEAFKRCPECLFVSPNFDKYEEVSCQIREIFREYTDIVEPVSLDEAYLDVTHNKVNEPSATAIALAIKKKIFLKTSLTASAGVAPNKFVAKIASDYKKPDGIFVVPPAKVVPFIWRLPVIKVPGIGKVTSRELQKLGINTVEELSRKSAEFLEDHFGKVGKYFFNLARGIDDSEVISHYERQSYGCEETFSKDIIDKEYIISFLRVCGDRVFRELIEKKLQARTVTVKIKYHNFTTVTRRYTKDQFIKTEDDLFEIIKQLLEKTEVGAMSVRLAGVALSNFEEKDSMNETKVSQIQLSFPFFKSHRD